MPFLLVMFVSCAFTMIPIVFSSFFCRIGVVKSFPSLVPFVVDTLVIRHIFISRKLVPSTIRCASAAAEGTSVLMHHLAEELSDLPTPPPARLQSRLLRWRSEDHGKERWKGVVDVLRVQSQVP